MTNSTYQVDTHLAQIRVELAGEAQRGGNARHDVGDQVVEVSVGRVGQLQAALADIVQRLVIDTKGRVCIFHQLVHGQGSIVRLDDGVGCARGQDTEGGQHTIGKLYTANCVSSKLSRDVHPQVLLTFSDLGQQQGTHSGASTTTQGVCKLESRQAVTSLGLAANNVNDLLNQLSTLGVVALCPVVGGRRLAIDKVVGSEQLTQGSCPHSVHGGRLEIDEDGTRDIFLVADFVQVDVSASGLLGVFAAVSIKQLMNVLAHCKPASRVPKRKPNTYMPS